MNDSYTQRTARSVWLLISLSLSASLAVAQDAEIDTAAPQAQDKRVVVELFAEHPQIVTPTGIAVDRRSRVFVAESHTHFRPADYQGPTSDRILMFLDTNGDGRADQRTVFHEGFTHVMDLAIGPADGLYVATRKDVHRLRDTNGDGRADQVQPIVVLETTGTYPHNGISGLAFDFHGQLNFGLGENLGHDYVIRGTDGRTFQGGGEGGSTYRTAADGSGLQRTSTGWWNPFGMCVDSFGRVFGTDNDPGASPPCRLIQLHSGADYGYEYRYGRTGLHPLISWTGQRRGLIPMISGTGEAPCEIVAYESDGLPDTYRGQLLVASWADHRIERFPLRSDPRHAQTRTQRATFISGNNEFRPVGITVAPDGSLYITDWVSSSYALHRLGRIWHVRSASRKPRPVLQTPADQLLSKDRRLREAAARQLIKTPQGRSLLETRLNHPDSRVRAVALQALSKSPPPAKLLDQLASNDPEMGVRALALSLRLDSGGDPLAWWSPKTPMTLRAIAVAHFDPVAHRQPLLEALQHPDPLVLHAAVQQLVGAANNNPESLTEYLQQRPLGTLLAMRRSQRHSSYADSHLKSFLGHANPRVRFHAIKWIADERLSDFRPDLIKLLDDKRTQVNTFLGLVTAIDRLDGRKPSDQPAADFLVQRILSNQAAPEVRHVSLQLLDPATQKLSLKQVSALLREDFEPLRLTAAQYLCRHHQPERFRMLLALAQDEQHSIDVRTTAVSGLAPNAKHLVNELLALCEQDQPAIRMEAARALIGVDPSRVPQAKWKQLSADPGWQQALQRLVSGTPGNRPEAKDTDAWLKLLPAQGDPAAGERIFMHSKVGTCGGCHRMRGRGRAVGPDLTAIHQRLNVSGIDSRRWLLQSLLQPGRDMAPQYTPWIIVTKDGKTVTGLPRRKGGSGEAYLGIDGREFTLKKSQIAFHRESTTSLMPAKLLNALTTTEISDLLAFLTASSGNDSDAYRTPR